jgi:hypothetical protein
MDIESNFFNCLSSAELLFIDNKLAMKPVLNSVLYTVISRSHVSKFNFFFNFFFKNSVLLNLRVLTQYIYTYSPEGEAQFLFGKDALVRVQNVLYKGTFDAVSLLDKRVIDKATFKFFY